MSRPVIRPILHAGWLRAAGRRHQVAFLSTLRQRQFAPRSETRREHEARLGAILRFSFEHVLYYREQFERLGLAAADVESRPLETLRALPPLDKTILRDRFHELQADDIDSRRWYYNTSGGSTGEAARFVQDSLYHQAGMAAKALFDEWTGYSDGMPKLKLWGSERDLLMGRETLRARLGAWLRNEHTLSTIRVSENDMANYVAVINRGRPVQILAYVEAAFELARFIEREGLRVHSPRAVMTSAGTLYPHMREVIERVFRAPVFNRYGSREVGDVACECALHCGLHINPYTHHVEILRKDGSPCPPGETGELFVTLLTNHVMPLLRYRIGDLAAWSEQPCACGRSWPTLQEVSGRINSIVSTRDGWLSSTAITTMLYYKDLEKKEPFHSFERYQLVQVRTGHFLFRVVVRDERLWEDEQKRIFEKLRSVLGEDVRIEFERTVAIAPGPSGKHQFVWSEMS